jgi:hypothetical protein
MRNGSLFWGTVLVLLGGLMLADAAGVRFVGGVRPSEMFFPVLLMLLGAAVILGVFWRGRVETEQDSVDLQGASQVRLRINHGAGSLKLHAGAGAGQLARGEFAGGLRQSARRSGDRLEVNMRPRQELFVFPFFGSLTALDWDVALNADVPLELKLETGANRAELDLRDLRVTGLQLDTGASDTRLTVPARGRLRADLNFGAASMDITIPDGVAARISVDHGVSEVQVAARFPRVGGVYKSPDFETAANAVDLDIDAGAASIRIH